MARHSAGLLPYRASAGTGAGGRVLEVFLVHMGGPFWARKDEGAWSIAKGEYDPATEDPRAVAAREFEEEVGCPVPVGDWTELGEARQSGKVVTAYALCTDEELAFVASNEVEMEWPPRSGRTLRFPEVDRAAWMPVAQARTRLVKGQRVFLDRLPPPPPTTATPCTK